MRPTGAVFLVNEGATKEGLSQSLDRLRAKVAEAIEQSEGNLSESDVVAFYQPHNWHSTLFSYTYYKADQPYILLPRSKHPQLQSILDGYVPIRAQVLGTVVSPDGAIFAIVAPVTRHIVDLRDKIHQEIGIEQRIREVPSGWMSITLGRFLRNVDDLPKVRAALQEGVSELSTTYFGDISFSRVRTADGVLMDLGKEAPEFTGKPHVIVIDCGATHVRVGVMNHSGELMGEVERFDNPLAGGVQQEPKAQEKQTSLRNCILDFSALGGSFIALVLSIAKISGLFRDSLAVNIIMAVITVVVIGIVIFQLLLRFMPQFRVYPVADHGYLYRPFLSAKQKVTVDLTVEAVERMRQKYPNLELNEVGVSFGAVVTHDGIVRNASVLWGEASCGYDFKAALEEKLTPGTRVTVINDVSAATWRYKDLKKFCLITVSSGLAEKVFDWDLDSVYKLNLDSEGVAGEMGHVIVNPEAQRRAVVLAIKRAHRHRYAFRRSRLYALTNAEPEKITAGLLVEAAKFNDEFALGVLADADAPLCACGNVADLCSYASGPAVQRLARRIAGKDFRGFQASLLYAYTSGDAEAITTEHIAQAAQEGDAFALSILDEATFYLALRILQLSADLGLEKFIITGGFALGVGQPYFESLRNNLVELCHSSGFFTGWDDERIRSLVEPAVGDDNDGLLGMGYFVQHLRTRNKTAHKAVRKQEISVAQEAIPECGPQDVVVRIIDAGICGTDIQLYLGLRRGEPDVLGHECLAEVIVVGEEVSGIAVGDYITINPNNPLDQDDKIGHSALHPGIFRHYYKFSKDLMAKKQILKIEGKFGPETVLLEGFSCVVNSQNLAKDYIPGKKVLVVGAGVMGQLQVAVARAYGAEEVFLVDRSQEKLDFAVQRGVVPAENTFIADEDLAQKVMDATEELGVDVVFIVVSMGNGLGALEQALDYIAEGGVINLFGGFRMSDELKLPEDRTIPIGPIRVNREIKWFEDVRGKRIALAGSRGALAEHYQRGLELVGDGRVDLSKFITHVVSLDALPLALEELSQQGRLQGEIAMRVVIDMALEGEVIMSYPRYIYHQLGRAAGKSRPRIDKENRFRNIGSEGAQARLGWVVPPAWNQVETAFWALRYSVLKDKDTFIICSTGNSIFAIETLQSLIGKASNNRILTLDSLDPASLQQVLSQVTDLRKTACIGISKSGKTTEPLRLMLSLREKFEAEGLRCQDHFMWLTDVQREDNGMPSGRETIAGMRDSEGQAVWRNVVTQSIKVDEKVDVDARFSAPHTAGFLLPLAVLLGGEEGIHNVKVFYAKYLKYFNSNREELIARATAAAEQIALSDSQNFAIRLKPELASALRPWILSLFLESLGSKQGGFNPKVIVTSENIPGGFKEIRIDLPQDTSAVVELMLYFYVLQVTVATAAYLRDINFVSHPKVNLYKRLVRDVTDEEISTIEKIDVPGLKRKIIDSLDAKDELKYVEVVCYFHITEEERQQLHAGFESYLGERLIGVFAGTRWNHHSYQSAVDNNNTLYVLLTHDGYQPGPELVGISSETLQENFHILNAIAYATAATLKDKSLLFALDRPKASASKPAHRANRGAVRLSVLLSLVILAGLIVVGLGVPAFGGEPGVGITWDGQMSASLFYFGVGVIAILGLMFAFFVHEAGHGIAAAYVGAKKIRIGSNSCFFYVKREPDLSRKNPLLDGAIG
ncbi:ROK family protein, partial [Candidatus Omnitrophota bacterium]